MNLKTAWPLVVVMVLAGIVVGLQPLIADGTWVAQVAALALAAVTAMGFQASSAIVHAIEGYRAAAADGVVTVDELRGIGLQLAAELRTELGLAESGGLADALPFGGAASRSREGETPPLAGKRFAWLAEGALTPAGPLYAALPGAQALTTTDPHAARQFATREDCAAFCATLLGFRPVEHGFFSP